MNKILNFVFILVSLSSYADSSNLRGMYSSAKPLEVSQSGTKYFLNYLISLKCQQTVSVYEYMRDSTLYFSILIDPACKADEVPQVLMSYQFKNTLNINKFIYIQGDVIQSDSKEIFLRSKTEATDCHHCLIPQQSKKDHFKELKVVVAKESIKQLKKGSLLKDPLLYGQSLGQLAMRKTDWGTKVILDQRHFDLFTDHLEVSSKNPINYSIYVVGKKGGQLTLQSLDSAKLSVGLRQDGALRERESFVSWSQELDSNFKYDLGVLKSGQKERSTSQIRLGIQYNFY